MPTDPLEAANTAETKRAIQFEGLRRSGHTDYVEAMREGRRQRAATFRSPKGPGSYRRRPKHRDRYQPDPD